MFTKVYDFENQTVFEADWMGPQRGVPCDCAGKPTLFQNKKVSFQCRIPSEGTFEEHKYCWRHERLRKQGKKIDFFPPGPVKPDA